MKPFFSLPCRSTLFLAVLAAPFWLLPSAGCGGGKARTDSSTADAVVGAPVHVEGVLSLRGSTPHTVLMLETGKDKVVMIESKTIQSELESLSGMRVAIDGESKPPIDGKTPLINALRYRMLRLPSGELPIVGVLNVVNELCILDAIDGKRYWIRGDFTGVIRDFDGAKIWVVGTLGDPAVRDKPEGTVPYWAIGYGVLNTR